MILMKRRKALLNISVVAGGALASYIGFKWMRFNAAPDFEGLLNHKKLIASLADTIIPPSGSPSASECQVHEFIVKMVMECTDAHTQNNFVTGLVELEEYATTNFKRSFVDCSPTEKNQILSNLEAEGKTKPGVIGKIEKKILGKSFFQTLKEYTVIGYFTSEQGANRALRYSHVPSKYVACQPYAVGEKAWATF